MLSQVGWQLGGSKVVPSFLRRSLSRGAYEKGWPGLVGVLKNNIKRQPAWQEIVDFS
jgi:hypothetical protein